MKSWDASLDPHNIDLTSKDICEGFIFFGKGFKDLHKGSKPYHSTPPHFTIAFPPLSTGINIMDIREGSPTLTRRPNLTHPPSAWLLLCTYHPLILAGFNAHLPWVYFSCTSHASGLFTLSTMSSPQILPHPHFTLNNGSVRYAISLERILLDVIAGVEEGVLQEIPWETLPLTRVFVKERLALTVFSTCLCTTQTGVSLWFSNIGSRLSLSIDDQSFIAGSNSILGYNYSG